MHKLLCMREFREKSTDLWTQWLELSQPLFYRRSRPSIERTERFFGAQFSEMHPMHGG